MPAGFEDSRLQSNAGAPVVVECDCLLEQQFYFGDVEGSCGIIPHSDELSYVEGGAILLVILGIGVGFGFVGVVGQ